MWTGGTAGTGPRREGNLVLKGWALACGVEGISQQQQQECDDFETRGPGVQSLVKSLGRGDWDGVVCLRQ